MTQQLVVIMPHSVEPWRHNRWNYNATISWAMTPQFVELYCHANEWEKWTAKTVLQVARKKLRHAYVQFVRFEGWRIPLYWNVRESLSHAPPCLSSILYLKLAMCSALYLLACVGPLRLMIRILLLRVGPSIPPALQKLTMASSWQFSVRVVLPVNAPTTHQQEK